MYLPDQYDSNFFDEFDEEITVESQEIAELDYLFDELEEMEDD